MLVPIQQFREAHNLPAEFSVSYFEPKLFEGLAAIDSAGADMNQLRQRVLKTIPQAIQLLQIQTLLDTLQATFRRELEAINDTVELKPSELDFAVAGFGDANQAFFYDLMRHHSNPRAVDYKVIYWQWLAGSTRLSMTVHNYHHADQTWQVQILNNVYGRIGLQVTQGDSITYVSDSIYACPADGYMKTLLFDVMQAILNNLNSG